MKVIDAVKNTAFTAAINSGLKYLEKDPEVNIPKLMSLVDKAAPEGWYEGARNMIRNAIEEKGNWYDLIMKIYQLDPGVRKNFFQNFIVNASLKGRNRKDVSDRNDIPAHRQRPGAHREARNSRTEAGRSEEHL